jgi:hypothetical protein
MITQEMPSLMPDSNTSKNPRLMTRLMHDLQPVSYATLNVAKPKNKKKKVSFDTLRCPTPLNHLVHAAGTGHSITQPIQGLQVLTALDIPLSSIVFFVLLLLGGTLYHMFVNRL